MKILYLHCTADLYGASRMMLRNITQQIRDGYEIHVILPYKGVLIEELEKIGVNVYITYLDPTVRKSYFKNPIKFIQFIYNCFRAINFYKKITKQLKFDLIVSNSSQIVVGGFLAKSKKIPHICHVRESYLENLIFWKIFEPFLLYTSDLLICVSQAMANQFYSKNNKD